MAAKRLAIFDPSGRLAPEVEPLAAEVGLRFQTATAKDVATFDHATTAAILVAPGVASEIGPMPEGGAPRWVMGDGANPGRVAGAAASASAVGVLLTPTSIEAITAIAHNE